MSTCRDRDTEGLGAHWTAIVCTCQNRESANAFRKGMHLKTQYVHLVFVTVFCVELLIRQQKRLICARAAILAVDDPKPNIGSGSATLNALISVTEWLAAQEGHKVYTSLA